MGKKRGTGIWDDRIMQLGEDLSVTVRQEQQLLCERVQAPLSAVETGQKLGVSLKTIDGGWPINGMRLQPERGTCGWYIWSGEVLSNDPDFFSPMHAEHLFHGRPEVVKYLGLPPGWRFLIAPDYEDVWYDASLLS